MVLVDSSSWIETLRVSGNAAVRARISELVLQGEAAWCDVVRVELWNGARGQKELRELAMLDTVVYRLAIDDEVWDRSVHLARRARAAGLTIPAADVIIVATAVRHSVQLDHHDKHLARLQQIV